VTSSRHARTSETSDGCGCYENAINLIESIRDGSNRPTDYPLPGHGDIRTDEYTCGDKSEPRFCPSCGHHHMCGKTCGRWECPRCWKRACLKRAVSICSKITEHRGLVEAERDSQDGSSPDKPDKPHAHRIIISPPHDFSTTAENPIEKLVDAGKSLLKKGGLTGGVIVPHLYRSDDESNHDDMGFWKSVLPDYKDDFTPDWSETREELSLEPHLHCYGVGDKFWLDTKTIEEQTDWNIERIEPYGSDDNHRSFKSTSHLVRSVMYALSHAPVSSGNMYRYFGRTANISAGEQMEAYIDRLSRNHAPKLLNLSDGISCETEVDEDDAENWFSESSGDESSSGQGESSDGKVKCGGRLLHIRNLDRFIGDNDWSEKTEQNLLELKDWYFSDSGEPPPID
jgi:hypothetical protein